MPLPDLSMYLNKFIEIRVHKSYLNRRNKAYRQRNFFGHDQYTSDSDIVCILQHSGHFNISVDEIEERQQILSNFESLAVVFKVLKSRNTY